MKHLPLLLKDGYKVGHVYQYPSDTTEVYSNLTPRTGQRANVDIGGVINFGLQYFIQEYLIEQFNENFFQRPRKEVQDEYDSTINSYLNSNISFNHVGALHELGFLPLRIKALPEGALVPYGVPVLTVVNTHPEFFWLTNMLETLMSSVLWKASTSATTAFFYRRQFEKYAALTGAPREFIPWQGHDFSFRGMCGVEDAAVSGAAHLLSFTGTDTIPAIGFLKHYYDAEGLIGGSVPATEHSVMCMGEPENELDTFKRLITEVYPDGIVSVVSDTWDLWRVLTEYLPALKDEILSRNGKLVIRPDSGDPVKIILGDDDAPAGSPQSQGVIQLLYQTFGGAETETGHIMLDEHIGCIYGDGINPERQDAILNGLYLGGFASSNIVLGMGSYTYQFVTRDAHGYAMKATAGRTKSRGLIEIFKDPVTDDGTKKSAKGLLCVDYDADGNFSLEQCVAPEREQEGELLTVFIDGQQIGYTTLDQIRARVEWELQRAKN